MGAAVSVQYARDRKRERCNQRVEIDTIVGFHPIQTLHRADRSLENRAAGVAKLLARLQVRLFANDAVATDFLNWSST